MAEATKKEIEALGITLNPGEAVGTKVLLGANVLTGLCYLGMRHNDGHRTAAFCTKNLTVIEKFADKYPIEGLEKGFEKYKDKFDITANELKSGVLNCVKLESDSPGEPAKIKAGKIHLNSKASFLAPYFAVFVFRNAVLKALSKENINIRLISGAKIKTSLAPKILQEHSLDSKEVYEKAISTDDLLSFVLPDLDSKKDVYVHMLEVASIVKA